MKKLILIFTILLLSLCMFSCKKADRGEISGVYYENNINQSKYTFSEDGNFYIDDEKQGKYESLGEHKYILKIGKKKYYVKEDDENIIETDGNLKLYSDSEKASKDNEKMQKKYLKNLQGKYIASVKGTKIELIIKDENLSLLSESKTNKLKAEYTIKIVGKNKFNIMSGYEVVETS